MGNLPAGAGRVTGSLRRPMGKEVIPMQKVIFPVMTVPAVIPGVVQV